MSSNCQSRVWGTGLDTLLTRESRLDRPTRKPFTHRALTRTPLPANSGDSVNQRGATFRSPKSWLPKMDHLLTTLSGRAGHVQLTLRSEVSAAQAVRRTRVETSAEWGPTCVWTAPRPASTSDHLAAAAATGTAARPGRSLPGQDFHLLETRTFARHTWSTPHQIQNRNFRAVTGDLYCLLHWCV